MEKGKGILAEGAPRAQTQGPETANLESSSQGEHRM